MIPWNYLVIFFRFFQFLGDDIFFFISFQRDIFLFYYYAILKNILIWGFTAERYPVICCVAWIFFVLFLLSFFQYNFMPKGRKNRSFARHFVILHLRKFLFYYFFYYYFLGYPQHYRYWYFNNLPQAGFCFERVLFSLFSFSAYTYICTSIYTVYV